MRADKIMVESRGYTERIALVSSMWQTDRVLWVFGRPDKGVLLGTNYKLFLNVMLIKLY